MKPFIVCSFYTKNTPYEEEIKIMLASCKRFNIPTFILSYDSRGTWVKNCAIKSEFVFEALIRNSDKNLVFLDSDAEIKQYPRLFESLTCDISAHYKDGWELMSNTIFMQNNSKVQQLVRYWITMQQENPIEWDQKVLDRCIKQYGSQLGIIFQDLPPTYAQIFDSMKKFGDPVIEQHQASRRFKKKISSGISTTLPESIKKLHPRFFDDGTFYLTRCTPDIEKTLKADYNKFTNEPRWFPKSKGSIPLSDLKRYFDGKECYIIGKGPSLDRLQAIDFPNQGAPIICLNESIRKVESLGIANKLFVLQQDAWLKETCRPKQTTTTMLLNHSCQNWYPDIGDKFIFHHLELGLKKRFLSVTYAIAIAKLCGVKTFKLLCFDAALTQNTGYAKIIGYDATRGGDPKRFLNHRGGILNHAKPIPLEFIPVTLAESSSCTPLLCKDNH